MQCQRRGIVEAAIGVFGEIDDDLGIRRQGTDHLDIEHDLVGAWRRRVVRGWRVAAHVHGSDFGRRFQPASLEVGGEVLGVEIAAQLDDGDPLADASARGEIV
jgi:hypothetical protein